MTDLFTYEPPYPKTPGFKDQDTSKEAARSMQGKAPLLRSRCLSLLKEAPTGLTADQVASRLGETVLAVRPRFTELQRDGQIEDTGERRANESGRSAKVWRTV